MWYEMNINEIEINFWKWRVKELYLCCEELFYSKILKQFYKVKLIMSSGGGMVFDSEMFVWRCG
jgi:hypothetical protein